MKRDETAAKRARAKRLAKRPDVVAWVDDLSRVMQSAPPGLWLFADSGNLTVMALGEDGRRSTNAGGGMDHADIVAHVDFGPRRIVIDGGDW